MTNDWQWEKIDDAEYRLKKPSGIIVAYLGRNFDKRWFCWFYNDDLDLSFDTTFDGYNNAEEVVRQATLWIYNLCNNVANSFHYIRDHLPSSHNLIFEE